MLLAHEAAGRSLLADPEWLALMRSYDCTVPVPARGSIQDAIAGHWYALALVPGAERKAMDRVADKVRLPTYLPLRRELRFTWRGVPFNTCRALFTGYGFVQLADIDRLLGRILACEGVRGIMCESGKPAIVHGGVDGCSNGHIAPQRYDHELIEFIRMVEKGAEQTFADRVAAMENSRRGSPQRKRRRRHSKRGRAAQ